MKKSIPRPGAKRWRLVLVAIGLIGYCGFAGEQATTAEDSPAKSEVEQGAVEQQPSPPAGPPAAIEGFRQALFGMTEEQVRQVVRKDFPAAAAKISSATHPSEKTTVLSVTVTDLLPDSAAARISYIFGYRSKKLIQVVNVVWTSDGGTSDDETIIDTANALRDYFTSQNYKPDCVIAKRAPVIDTGPPTNPYVPGTGPSVLPFTPILAGLVFRNLKAAGGAALKLLRSRGQAHQKG
jgi:hypothetical protein